MTIRVTIKHDQQPGSATPERLLKVTVVTVGDQQAGEQRHVLSAGQEVSVHVHGGQFVMVDESDNKEGG